VARWNLGGGIRASQFGGSLSAGADLGIGVAKDFALAAPVALAGSPTFAGDITKSIRFNTQIVNALPFAGVVTTPAAALQYSTGVGQIDRLSVGWETATPEQIGIYAATIAAVAVGSTVAVRYKTSGSGTWLTAHPLLRIDTANYGGPTTLVDSFAGTIFDLLPNTTYDVELTHVEAGQSAKVSVFQRTTRALPSTAGAPNRTANSVATIGTQFAAVNAGDVLEIANGTYDVSGLTLSRSGTSGSPIYIRGASKAGTILRKLSTGSILALQASHVVIENMTLQGTGTDAGAEGNSTSIGVRITNANTDITIRTVDLVGVDEGITANPEQTGTLVYECTITGNDVWDTTNVNGSPTWGDQGVELAGYGNCVFNNTIKGFGDTFSFATTSNDSLRSEGNYAYRNLVRNSCDDVVEFDYCTRNIAVYDNIITNCGTALSLSYPFGGPCYYFRNVVVNTTRGPYKCNGDATDITGFLIYNNTVVRTDGTTGWGMIQNDNGSWRNFSFRNNLLVYRGAGGGGGIFAIDPATQAPLDFDYNAWYPDGKYKWTAAPSSNGSTLATAISDLANDAISPLFGSSQRMQHDVLTATNPFAATITLGADHLTEYTGTPDATLAGAGTARNAGVAIPGITDGFSGAAPDIGAVIAGRARPIVGAWVPPFALPSTVNTSSVISQNTLLSIKPAAFSGESDVTWYSAAFGSFSGPVFATKFTTAGAFVFSNTGGHFGPQNVDLVYWDVTDGKWKYALNGNGIATQSGDFAVAATTGYPYFEINASSPAGMQAGGHCYTRRSYVENSGKGRLYEVAQQGTTSSSLPDTSQSTGCHYQNLDTRVWARAGNGTITMPAWWFEGSNVYDAANGRIYYVPKAEPQGNWNQLQYLRLSDHTVQTTGAFSVTGSQQTSGNFRTFGVPSKRLMVMHHKFGLTNSMSAWDITSDSTISSSGCRVLTLSGTAPPDPMHWVEHPNGKLYAAESQPNNTLWVLTPPSSNYLTNTWTVSTIAVGGAGLPARTLSNNHYSCLQYVPSIGMLVFVNNDTISGAVAIKV
jgi:hypothetical protein